MKTIRISEDVWNAMAERGKFGETPDDVLRRVFAIKEPSKKMKTGNRAILPPNGTNCKMDYKGKSYKGLIVNGSLVVSDIGNFSSLSAAACQISGVSLNGWLYWLFKLIEESDWIPALEWRRRGK